ncbi:MAG: hypothetical protein JO199_14610 [Candidatus Eremiobacteraeota bacterium]|nr:hypothetical protein [Candidatus Eremiobacteraeota bacterium]
MKLAYVVVAIAGAAYVARAIHQPFADGDLFWQKHLGAYVLAHGALPWSLGSETFTAAGVPWTPQEWLLGTAASLAISHHALVLLGVAAGAAVALAMLLCAWRASDAGASDLSVAICLALLAVGVEGSFGIRAQVFAWPLLCALFWLLDRRGRAIFWSLPVVAVWANVHASALLAVPLVWIDALVTVATKGIFDGETRRRLILAAILPLATLATPLGVRLWTYATMLLFSPIRHSIKEWQPIGWGTDFFWYGVAPMLALALLCARTLARERPRDIAWVLLLAGMAANAVRNVSLLGFALVPLAARAIDVLLGRFSWWPLQLLRSAGPRRLAVGATAVTAVAVAIVTLTSPPAKSAFATPVATFAEIAALPGEHRVFCYDFAVCSIALDYPNLRVFMDGRADPFPLAIWNDFNTIRFAHPGWQSRLDAWKVEVVVAKRNDSLARQLRALPEWQALPAVDRCCVVYRRVAPSGAVIRGWWSRFAEASAGGRTAASRRGTSVLPQTPRTRETPR